MSGRTCLFACMLSSAIGMRQGTGFNGASTLSDTTLGGKASASQETFKVNASGPSSAIFHRSTAEECYGSSDNYGEGTPQPILKWAPTWNSLGEEIANGAFAQVWCVTAPGSDEKCPAKCLPLFAANPACLILRRAKTKTEDPEAVEVTTRITTDIQMMLAENGIAPAVTQVWQCDSPGEAGKLTEVWTVMEPALGETLKTIVRKKELAMKIDEEKGLQVSKEFYDGIKQKFLKGYKIENEWWEFKGQDDVNANLQKECPAIMEKVKAMHSLNVMHKDLHWDNVFINGNKAQLIDFDGSSVLRSPMMRMQAAQDLRTMKRWCEALVEQHLANDFTD